MLTDDSSSSSVPKAPLTAKWLVAGGVLDFELISLLKTNCFSYTYLITINPTNTDNTKNTKQEKYHILKVVDKQKFLKKE